MPSSGHFVVLVLNLYNILYIHLILFRINTLDKKQLALKTAKCDLIDSSVYYIDGFMQFV